MLISRKIGLMMREKKESEKEEKEEKEEEKWSWTVTKQGLNIECDDRY